MKATRMMVGVMGCTMWVGSASALAETKRDERIKDRIENRLERDAQLKDDSVEVEVDRGTVTLKGTVDSNAEKVRAAKVAKVAGVKSVENQLEVGSRSGNGDTEDRVDRLEDRAEKQKDQIEEKAETAKDRVEQRTEAAKDRIENKAEKAEARGSKAKSEAGSELGDAWITTKLKLKFVSEDLLDGSDISVDTNQAGVVTLTGTVPNERARLRAVDLARQTEGVREVRDELRVAPDRR